MDFEAVWLAKLKQLAKNPLSRERALGAHCIVTVFFNILFYFNWSI